jgi:cellobiose-specific phosphotransferase system component IIC
MMRTLRPRFVTLLFILLVSSIFLLMPTHPARAQSSELVAARQDLVQAFQSIQTAEQQGASNSDLLPLTAQLNIALQYEETADMFSRQGNETLSVQYAVQSIGISSQVSLKAQNLASTAQAASLYRTTLSYILAVIVALLVAVTILEAGRIRLILRRRRLLKARIDYGGREHAT